MKGMITIFCPECSHYQQAPEYSDFDGARYGTNWGITCPKCRQGMEEVEYRRGGACAFVLKKHKRDIWEFYHNQHGGGKVI